MYRGPYSPSDDLYFDSSEGSEDCDSVKGVGAENSRVRSDGSEENTCYENSPWIFF